MGSRWKCSTTPRPNRTAEQIDDAVTGATHDNMNRLLSHQQGARSASGGVERTCDCDGHGKPAAVDASNQFTGSAPVPPGTSNVVVTATDPAGNLRTNTYQVSGSGSTRSFSYDNNGNLASKVEGAITTTYEWDAENQLTAINQGALRSEFTYDGGAGAHGLSNRVIRWSRPTVASSLMESFLLKSATLQMPS